MAFGVFIHRADSIYDDFPAERYQFPRQYLSRIEACVNDWVIYYEPVKVADAKGYFAIAKVQEIVADSDRAGMYLAIIEPGSYLDFPNPVPFKSSNGVVERGVLNEQGAISGRAQAAVRVLSPSDFRAITDLGFDDTTPLPRVDPVAAEVGFQEEQAPFIFDEPRSRVEAISSRIVRNRMFRRSVLRAYDERCAITGWKLLNGGGRAEVEAAHIMPVEANGPDSIANGIALSGTVHWMFDRGLISLSDDLEILVSRHVNDPNTTRNIINQSGRATLPVRPRDRPNPTS